MSKTIKNFTTIAVLVSGMFLFSGCAVYDWLCAQIQTAFSSGIEYKVSVVDCKNFKVPDQLIPVVPKLSAKLSESIREGVVAVGQMPKFQNIDLADKIPSEEFKAFQDNFFDDEKGYNDQLKVLRKYADDFKSNIIVWGATMGDDSKMAFMGWLYRRDIDVITNTNPLLFENEMSEFEQESLVKSATVGLLKKSLEDRPIGVGGKVANDLQDNKKGILTVVGSALSFIIMNTANGMMNDAGGYDFTPAEE